MRYLRYSGKFETWAFIFMNDGLGNCSKGYGDCKVLSMYVRRFEEYIVDLFKQFKNTNQFTQENI